MAVRVGHLLLGRLSYVGFLKEGADRLLSRDVRSLLQLVLSKLRHILQVEMLWPLLDALGVVLGVVIIRRLLLILKVLKTCGY